MAFDLLSTLMRPRKKTKPEDRFEWLVHTIEQSAPKEHARERETHYYNYRMVARYRKPLEGLLEAISGCSQSHSNPDRTAELFFKLKAFYDINDRLNMKEAMNDRNLVKKFSQLFLLFYNVREKSAESIRSRMIKGMETRERKA